MTDTTDTGGLRLPSLSLSKWFYDNIGRLVSELIDDVKQAFLRQPGAGAPSAAAFAGQLSTAALMSPVLVKYGIAKASAFTLIKLTCGWIAREGVAHHLRGAPSPNPVMQGIEAIRSDLQKIGAMLWRLEPVPKTLQEIIAYLKNPQAVRSEEMRLRADEAYRQGLKSDAITDLKLAISPEHGDYRNYGAHRMLAHILFYDDQDYEPALHYTLNAIRYGTAASQDPALPAARQQYALRETAEAHLLAAKIYLRMGDIGTCDALRECTQALELDPQLVHAQFELARCHAKSEDGKAAAACLENAVSSLTLYHELADIDAILKDVPEVRGLLDRLLGEARAVTDQIRLEISSWLAGFLLPTTLDEELQRAEQRLSQEASYTEHKQLHADSRQLLSQVQDLHNSHLHEVKRVIEKINSGMQFIALDAECFVTGNTFKNRGGQKTQYVSLIKRMHPETLNEQITYTHHHDLKRAVVNSFAMAGIIEYRIACDDVKYHNFFQNKSQTINSNDFESGHQPAYLYFVKANTGILAVVCNLHGLSFFGSYEVHVEIWDAGRGKRKLRLQEPPFAQAHIPNDQRPRIIASPDTRFIACYYGKELLLWDCEQEYGLFSRQKGKLIYRFHKLDARFPGLSVCFSPDSRKLLFARDDGKMILYDTLGMAVRHALKGSSAGNKRFCFSSDSSMVATIDANSSSVRICDAAKGCQTAYIACSGCPIAQVAFRPGDKLLYVFYRETPEREDRIGVYDTLAKQWKETTIRVPGPAQKGKTGWEFFVFSADGSRAVSKQVNNQDETHWTSWLRGFPPRVHAQQLPAS